MAPRLPNVLIYLSTLIRPSKLRPDLRVRTIADVDYIGLRRQGFNAVVVDKDNCVTLPEDDECFPPFKAAWSDLLAAFEPGRVLVVSNSAGTRKDPLGIAAESVSHHLKAPVLVHAQPKPGCGPEIIKYFRGELGKPSTRTERYLEKIHNEQKQMQEDLEMVLRANEEERLDREINRIRQLPPGDAGLGRTSITLPGPSSPLNTVEPKDKVSTVNTAPQVDGDLRILVIGDRLFTDTLLAHRLRLLLPSSKANPSVLSIHTTSLPQPRDVRLLRWIEEGLSRGRLRDTTEPWAKFAALPEEHAVRPKRWSVVVRWEKFKQDIRDSRMGWDPRKWTVKSVSVGIGKCLTWIVHGIWRVGSDGGRFVWTRSRKLYLDRRKARELELEEQARLASSAEAKILGIETGIKGETRRIAARDLESVERIEHKALPMIAAPGTPTASSSAS